MNKNVELQLTNDYIFKRLFSKKGNEDILKDLLEGILEIPIEKVEVMQEVELERVDIKDKLGVLDISCIFHCNVWNYLALEYMLCDFVHIASKYVGRYWMFIWNCHWTYIKSGKFIFRKSGIVFFQLL